jgi:hypothetical protein
LLSVCPLGEAKGTSLQVDICEGLKTTGDIDSLIRLFVNLLDNAIKYIKKRKVSLSAFRVQKAIHVDVNAIGVEFHQNINHNFSSVSTAWKPHVHPRGRVLGWRLPVKSPRRTTARSRSRAGLE